MPRSRTTPAAAILTAAVLVCAPAPAQTGSVPARTTPVRAAFNEEWGARRWKPAERVLEDAFKSDASRAREACLAILTGPDTSARALAAVMLARHGAPADLAGVARSLDAIEFPDERRRLVRAVGIRAAKDEDPRPALEALRGFLRDRDWSVRNAAAQGLADLGRAEAVADLAEFVQKVPAYSTSDTLDEREAFRRSACGAIRDLTGLRPRSTSEVRAWLSERRPAVREAPAPSTPPLDVWNGQEFALAPSFDVYMRVADLKSAPVEGPLGWASLVKGAEAGAAAARRAMEPIAGGPVHVPIARLYLCDAREFPARAGVTFFQGVTKSNEIVIKLDPPAALAGTMAHEYVHWVHQHLYDNQPRWMSEGLATSLTASGRASVWKGRAPSGELAKMVERGIFTELFNWNSGGSSDSREAARYSLSHVAVDFLRFGGFSVAEERLAFFMGRLARRESPTHALQAVYGMDTRSMDHAAAAWLSGASD